jgi:DNA-binding response OmpR family regulator
MPYRVLVVEDSPTQAEQIKVTLEAHGLLVEIVSDGPDAIREAMRNPPQLVVLDINLPSMDGYQVCRRLKRNAATRDVPVIMLTEHASPKETMTGLQSGADDYIPKDVFAGEHLLDSLRELGLIE